MHFFKNKVAKIVFDKQLPLADLKEKIAYALLILKLSLSRNKVASISILALPPNFIISLTPCTFAMWKCSLLLFLHIIEHYSEPPRR